VVTLTATADTGSAFAGWSGDCSGTGDCVLTVDAAKSVTATFDVVEPAKYEIYLPVIFKGVTP
jgi:hypothetical protein